MKEPGMTESGKTGYFKDSPASQAIVSKSTERTRSASAVEALTEVVGGISDNTNRLRNRVVELGGHWEGTEIIDAPTDRPSPDSFMRSIELITDQLKELAQQQIVSLNRFDQLI